MSDAEHAFDPHWPHGHLYFYGDALLDARVRLIDAAGPYPIVAEVSVGGKWRVQSFTPDGSLVEGSKVRLINRPAPEPVVVEMRRHINDYFFRGARTPDGLPPHVRIETTATLFSDGTVRASAEVVK